MKSDEGKESSKLVLQENLVDRKPRNQMDGVKSNVKLHQLNLIETKSKHFNYVSAQIILSCSSSSYKFCTISIPYE